MKTILIGKAKNDFYKWYSENIHISKLDTFFNQEKAKYLYKIHFISQSEICKNAIIIEWFDSVGTFILIDFIACYEGNDFSYWFWTIKNQWIDENYISSLDNDVDDYFKTRNQATIKAIEEAVKIYNS